MQSHFPLFLPLMSRRSRNIIFARPLRPQGRNISQANSPTGCFPDKPRRSCPSRRSAYPTAITNVAVPVPSAEQ